MFSQLTDMQVKNFINTEQLHLALKDAMTHAIDYRGGLSWKVSRGVEYLYRTLDRNGSAKYIGPRNEKTENIFKQFSDSKLRSSEKISTLKEKIAEQARLNKALKINRCPQIVADIANELDVCGLMGGGIEIIGTNALYAYESMAGVQILQESLATSDVDLLFDTRSKISLVAPEGLSENGVLGILRKADKSFSIVESKNFRAVNKSGFLVDLIRQMPSPPWKEEASGLADGDLKATDIWNMKWILSMPKVSQTVIATNGIPVMMVVPDPRAFAMFKFWLSESDERDPKKKRRDLAQALIVKKIIDEYLPQYQFSADEMKSFPADIVSRSGFCINHPMY